MSHFLEVKLYIPLLGAQFMTSIIAMFSLPCNHQKMKKLKSISVIENLIFILCERPLNVLFIPTVLSKFNYSNALKRLTNQCKLISHMHFLYFKCLCHDKPATNSVWEITKCIKSPSKNYIVINTWKQNPIHFLVKRSTPSHKLHRHA